MCASTTSKKALRNEINSFINDDFNHKIIITKIQERKRPPCCSKYSFKLHLGTKCLQEFFGIGLIL